MDRTTAENGAAKNAQSERKPIRLLRRIGSTTYEVTVHYSNENKDTMADIVRRVLEREVDRSA
jgi:hypothetical protein